MFRELGIGITTYGKALELISKLRLWKYFMIPVALGILLFTLLVFLGYALSDNLSNLIQDWYPFESGQETYGIITEWLAGFSIVLLGLIVFKHALMAVSAPFMSPVSEKIEAYVFPNLTSQLSDRETSNIQQLVRGTRINLRNLVRELLITLPCLVLSLIPVIGIVFVFLSLLVQSYYAGFGNMDYTLERHKNYRDSLTFVKEHRGLAIGNGLVFTGILFIPVIGVLLVLPLSATAATLATLQTIKTKSPTDEGKVL